MHSFIRDVIGGIFGEDRAESTTIMYGGSVKPDNAGRLLSMDDIDGALVGGASLDPGSFLDIVYAL
jgi:triosephosphate isomerase